jgi:hypothetical protein
MANVSETEHQVHYAAKQALSQLNHPPKSPEPEMTPPDEEIPPVLTENDSLSNEESD